MDVPSDFFSREEEKPKFAFSEDGWRQKHAHTITSYYSLASPSEKGESSCGRSPRSGQGPCEYSCLHLSNAAITWPLGLNGEEDDLAVTAQMYGDVIRSSMP